MPEHDLSHFTRVHPVERHEPLSSAPVHAGRFQMLAEYYTDEAGNPTGGRTNGHGFSIEWQRGVEDANGAIVEDVVAAVIDRIEYFQASKFACAENAAGIEHLRNFLELMSARQKRRQAEGNEGSYRGN